MSRFFCLIICVAISLGSCEEYMESKRTETVESFSVIQVYNTFEITVTAGAANQVEIVGDEDVVPLISVSVHEDQLMIKNTGGNNWLNPDKAHVKLNIVIDTKKQPDQTWFLHETCAIQSQGRLSLTSLNIVNHSHVKMASIMLEIDAAYFNYWNNFQAGGELLLKGQVDALSIRSFALMSIDARELVAQNADIENSSKGHVTTTVVNSLTWAIFGDGNIYVYGNPPIETVTDSSGSGKLIRRDD